MKTNSIAKGFLLAAAVAIAGHSIASDMGPTEALKQLKEGNARFTSGNMAHPHADSARRRALAKGKQTPFATILSCSDSRVPVELLFDTGLGDLFGVRIAGNVGDTDEIGSIEYGVEHLGTQLLVVLGHSKCGAVTAVVEHADVHGSIPRLVDNISPAVDRAKEKSPKLEGVALVPSATKENVLQSISDIVNGSEIVRHLIKEGKLEVIGAIYDLESGEIEWLGPHPDMSAMMSHSGEAKEKPSGHHTTQASHRKKTEPKELDSTLDKKPESGSGFSPMVLIIGVVALAGIVAAVIWKPKSH